MGTPDSEKDPQKATEIVDDMIKTLEARVQILQVKCARAIQTLKSIRAMGDLVNLETINQLVDQVTQSLNLGDDNESDGESNVTRRSYAGTVVERVRHFFADTRNEPATNATIREAIGTSRGTLAMVLYSTHSDEFEHFPSGTRRFIGIELESALVGEELTDGRWRREMIIHLMRTFTG